MESDLVSGPDLGAGYLHQLSRDREGETTTFTYHAQVGGSDANGPPVGPLDPLGFVHPPSPCMFGGPHCWHRRFLLPLTAALRVRQAYNRHRFVLEAVLAQQYRGTPPDVDGGISEVVARLAGPLARDGIEWYVGGSAASYLLGNGLPPRDLDLGTTRAGVDRISELLAEYLVEPLAATDWAPDRIVRAARAFVGTLQSGLRVEWAVPIEPGAPRPFEEFSGRPGVARLEVADVRGVPVKVTRPEYLLVRAAERAPGPRFDRLAAWVGERGLDRELLEVLLDRSALSDVRRAEIRRAMGPP